MQSKVSLWVSRIVVVGLHLGCLLAIWSGVSWSAGIVCLLAYIVRGFGITGGFHRCFSHRAFQAGRVVRTCLGVLGTLAVQGGPLHWSRVHRHHHRTSDQPEDLHSPKQPSFWWSHFWWTVSRDKREASGDVKDLEKRFPELAWIEKYQALLILGFVAFLYGLGELLGAPYGTSGFQMVVWGFIISTVWTWHITWCVNSVTHTWGSRRFETEDDSRNNWLIGILALGEGHHNNHHANPGLARQGLFWWEFDPTYYLLRLLARMGWIWDLNEPIPEVYDTARHLARMRRKLSRLDLAREAISARLRDGQRALAPLLTRMANLRNKARKMQAETGRVTRELSDSIKEGGIRFREMLNQAETLTLA